MNFPSPPPPDHDGRSDAVLSALEVRLAECGARCRKAHEGIGDTDIRRWARPLFDRLREVQD